MTPQLEEKLRSIGWFPGRRIEDDQFHEWLHFVTDNFGCRIFPEAVRILREYGNLTYDWMYFNPTKIPTYAFKWGWLCWEWSVNEILYPIGYAPGYTLTIAISSTGKVYGGDAGGFFLYGNSFEQFLTNILERLEPVEIRYVAWTSEFESEFDAMHDAIYGPETDK